MNPLRRKLLSGVGFFAGLVTGITVTNVSLEISEKKNTECVDHLVPPNNATTIQVMLTTDGNDRYWMKIGNEWKRISIDA